MATRISGTDGVSLEAQRWREIFLGMGHKVILVAGELDREGFLIPELHFANPKIVRLHDRVTYGNGKYREIEAKVFEMAGVIEGKLRDLFNSHNIPDLLIVPNVLSLPMHFPLAVALTRVISELNIKTLARHHDFWWERDRYLNSDLFDFFKRWFPPNLPQIKHVVINSISQKELKNRTGLDSTIIWDCFDFKSKINNLDKFNSHFREDFKIKPDKIIFLQATRIVPRKRIEISIELISKLKNKNIVFVVAGYAGDEAGDYEKKIKKLAKQSGISYRFVGKCINSKRKVVMVRNGRNPKSRRIYTLWDAFVNSDFVTYPSEVEGFGNQFVESVYFKKPVILTPYPVYKSDIKKLGFKTIEITKGVNSKVLEKVKNLMEDKAKYEGMVNDNFEIGEKYFSYEWVRNRLQELI